MENVPDILNYGGHNIAEEIVEALGKKHGATVACVRGDALVASPGQHDCDV